MSERLGLVRDRRTDACRDCFAVDDPGSHDGGAGYRVIKRFLPIALALAALAAPAAAQARLAVGIGDQKFEMYADSRLYWLGIKHTRIIVSWEVARVPWESWWVDRWLK